MFGLEGKAVLVTGATGGIGHAIALACHQGGATIVLSGTRSERLDALASEFRERVHVIPADLARPEDAARLVREAEGFGSGLDVLVNNAGVTRDGLALRMKDADWQTVIDINLTASFRLARAVLRGMVRQRWGRIISIASIVGVMGNPGQANYAASKAGLMGMSKALAHEVADRGVTVNCVAPGFIETAMTEALTPEQRDALTARIPAARLGSPADVAACVRFLASDEAGYITGQTLHVNGGMVMP